MNNILKWDEYFYKICKNVGSNSKCLSRQIGCIMVRDKTIIGTGYNGPPRGIPRCDTRWDDNKDWNLIDTAEFQGIILSRELVQNRCPRYILGSKSGEKLEFCLAGHAERNALINSARMGICTKDATLYMDCGIPCKDCIIEIINAGIKELVVISMKYYDKQTKYLVDNSKIKIRKFSHLE